MWDLLHVIERLEVLLLPVSIAIARAPVMRPDILAQLELMEILPVVAEKAADRCFLQVVKFVTPCNARKF